MGLRALGYKPWEADAGLLEEFHTICLFLFFIFYVKSMYLPVPQHRCCCQTAYAPPSFPRPRVLFPVYSDYQHSLPQTALRAGASQASGAAAATSQFLDFSFRNGRFQGPEQWIFCSTSASLCRGRVVDWEWAGVYGDCSVVCPGLPGMQQSLMERTLALELVRPVFVSQLCPYLCAFGKITF